MCFSQNIFLTIELFFCLKTLDEHISGFYKKKYWKVYMCTFGQNEWNEKQNTPDMWTIGLLVGINSTVQTDMLSMRNFRLHKFEKGIC